MEKKLYRDEHRKVIGGVCAGLADYFGVDVSVVRAIFAISLVLKGIGFIPYIVLWIVLPKKIYNFNNPNINPGVDYTNFNPNFNQGYNNPNVDYTVPPPSASQPFMPSAKKSNAGLIFGVVLIVLGASFLLDEFDIIPEFDFEKLWPVILVAIGFVLIFTGQKKQPWDKEDWHHTRTTAADEKTKNGDAAENAGQAEKKDDQNNPPII